MWMPRRGYPTNGAYLKISRMIIYSREHDVVITYQTIPSCQGRYINKSAMELRLQLSLSWLHLWLRLTVTIQVASSDVSIWTYCI